MPTDTVYGLAASLEHPDADRRALSPEAPTDERGVAGARAAARDAIEALGVAWPTNAHQLSDAFWPGALTIVVPAHTELASSVGGAGSIGFRIPDDELLLGVLDQCGALAVSSANEHGEPPCHNAQEVLGVLGSNELLSGVLDGGERRGEVSTVVEIVGDSRRILRSGPISGEEIERLLA